LKLIRLFIDKGIDVNCQDRDFRTPIHYAFITYRNEKL
jgi:ankyrin repeat protein